MISKLLIAAVLLAHVATQAQTVHYDPREAANKQMVRQLEFQTRDCLHTAVRAALSQGERDSGRIAVWASVTCGKPLVAMTGNNEAAVKRVLRMAHRELAAALR